MKSSKSISQLNITEIQEDDTENSIMVVDDSKFARNILCDILRNDGFQVVDEAKNGLEAIEIAKEKNPKYIFLDVEMPLLDGLGAIPRILEINPEVHIIMCTAMGQKSIIVEAAKAGAKDYVIKPYKKENILRVLNVIIESKKKNEKTTAIMEGNHDVSVIDEAVTAIREENEQEDIQSAEEEPEVNASKIETETDAITLGETEIYQSFTDKEAITLVSEQQEAQEIEEVISLVPEQQESQEIEEVISLVLKQQEVSEIDEIMAVVPEQQEASGIDEIMAVDLEQQEVSEIDEIKAVNLEQQEVSEIDEIKAVVPEQQEASGIDEIMAVDLEQQEVSEIDEIKAVVPEQQEASGIDEIMAVVPEEQEVSEIDEIMAVVPEEQEVSKIDEIITVLPEQQEVSEIDEIMAVVPEQREASEIEELIPVVPEQQEVSEIEEAAILLEVLKSEENQELRNLLEEITENGYCNETDQSAVKSKRNHLIRISKTEIGEIPDRLFDSYYFSYLLKGRFELEQENSKIYFAPEQRISFQKLLLPESDNDLVEIDNSCNGILSGLATAYIHMEQRLQPEENNTEKQINVYQEGMRVFTGSILEGKGGSRTDITISDLIMLSANKEQSKVVIQINTLSKAVFQLVHGKVKQSRYDDQI